MYFPNVDPIGKEIRLAATRAGDAATGRLLIVGIAPNIRQRSTGGEEFDPVVYVPYAANLLPFATILVKSPLEVGAVAERLRDEVSALNRDLPLFDVRTLDTAVAFAYWPTRVFGAMFTTFALMALVLAAVGLYGVTAYSVSQRTREIGIRTALGAQARQIWWTVTRRVSVPVAIGLLLGILGALGMGRAIQGLLTAVHGTDLPRTLWRLGAALARRRRRLPHSCSPRYAAQPCRGPSKRIAALTGVPLGAKAPTGCYTRRSERIRSKIRDVRDRGRFIGTLTVVTVLYFLAGTLGLSFAAVNASVTAVWPPAGIAVAALLVLGLRAWPAAAIGAFLTNLTASHEVVPSIVIATGNTLECLAAAMLATRFARGRFAFELGADILRFTVVSALVAPIIAATVGTATLRLTGLGSPGDTAIVWLTWWLGDATEHCAVHADVRAVDGAPAARPDWPPRSRCTCREPCGGPVRRLQRVGRGTARPATRGSHAADPACGRHFVSARGRRRRWVWRCR